MYRSVPQHVDLVESEREILRFWDDERIFLRSLEASRNGEAWTLFEGPPTANGTPGTHHIEARTFKDIFPRFKTMQGYHVERKAGWDCHGLPVELAVEKELGFSGKPDIEGYGIAEFNAKCRESVMRHVDEWQQLTRRMGYWIDVDHPYKTMDTSYIESVWWSLKQIYLKGLLEEDYRVAPYCPRCETTLSDHELAQGYEEDTDPSVYVRMPVTSGPLAGGASLLVWTTTPWTLVSNTAVAVNPGITYAVATDGHEKLVLAESLVAEVLSEGWSIESTLTGDELEGWAYARPFELIDFPRDAKAHYVVTADYVTATDGTGLVHQSPAFGDEDMAVAKANDLPVVNPVESNGHFEDDLPLVGGKFFKDADQTLVEDLAGRGVLFASRDFVHQYPHCWRCHTHLMYYALPAWYVRTTKVKRELLEQNELTEWHPSTIKHGRYGDWLDNNVDWALSRTRYWGTPLPIWRNDATEALIVVGSLAELAAHAKRNLDELDPHRPYIDDVTFSVEGEEGIYRRVPDVIDAWYDSGAMPFAQWGYPHVPGSQERFANAYPADYICEAIDQTRGWFYSLMAVGTLVHGQSSYRNVVCLGHILAEDGRKMSKHLGNILLPIPLMDAHSADSVRWFMACSGSPWSSRLIGDQALEEVTRKVLLTYWNTVAFQVLYGNAAGWDDTDEASPVRDRPVLDRWLLSETHRLVLRVTEALQEFDTQRAGSELLSFLDLLSNWYVRRSRRRFWAGDADALATLHETLRLVTLLLAPITPFITERVWRDLFASPEAPSVHLATWPVADPTLIDDDLDECMRLTRRVVELGRAARAAAKIKTRQPLRRAVISTRDFEALGGELRNEIAGELNVNAIESFATTGDLLTYTAKGNYRELGRRFGKRTPVVAAAIEQADAAALFRGIVATGEAVVLVEGEGVVVATSELIISERPHEGWSVANSHGETVALDLELDDDLRRAGVAREIVRAIQDARKRSGLAISDQIRVWIKSSPRVLDALDVHGTEIAHEVFATRLDLVDDANDFVDEDIDLAFRIQADLGPALA